MQEQETEEQRITGRQGGAAGSVVRKRVLIVDDQPEERAIFARYMEFVGGVVLEASNGEEGVRLAGDHLPSVILMDLSMPVLDGWGAIRRLKRDPRTAAIPVMALTAHQVDWRRLSEAGFCGYLEKPIVPFRVLEQVEQCIGRLAWSDAHAASRHGAPGGAATARPRRRPIGAAALVR